VQSLNKGFGLASANARNDTGGVIFTPRAVLAKDSCRYDAEKRPRSGVDGFARYRVAPDIQPSLAASSGLLTYMETLQAFNHGDGTMTVFIRCQEHIDWLRVKGVRAPLAIGDVLLQSEDRRKVYPTMSEAMEDSGAVARYLDVLETITKRA
jgi:hypothetical protein